MTAEPVPTIDGFSELVQIGRGGFSTVYAATQAGIERRVAIKVLDLGFSDERRFQRECRTLGSLSAVHGIVPVVQATFTRTGQPCIVMQLMDGGSLSARIRSSGPLSPSDVIRNGAVLCTALQTAHDARIFHRDIKPENVLFHGNDAAIADFGIALVDDVESRSQTIDSISPPHAPPERFMDGTSDPVLGDVYSLGSTLYTALAGRPPFGTASDGGLAGLILRVTTQPPPSVQRSDVPADLLEVLNRAMAKDPLGRFQSMGSFGAALAAVDTASMFGSTPVESTVRRRAVVAPLPPPLPITPAPQAPVSTVTRAASTPSPAAGDVGTSPGQAPALSARRRRTAIALWSAAGVLLVLAIAGGAYLIGQRTETTDAAAAEPAAARSSTTVAPTSTATPTTTPPVTAPPPTTAAPTTAAPATTAAPTTAAPMPESEATTAVDLYLAAASGFDVDAFAGHWAYPVEQQYTRRNVDEETLRASAAEYFARFSDLVFERVGPTAVTASANGWETTTRYRAEQWPLEGPYKCETATIRLGFDRAWRLRTASEDDYGPC